MHQSYSGKDKYMGMPSSTPVQPIKPSTFIRQLAAKLPKSISLGCASWSYPGWKGIVWDEESDLTSIQETGLKAYAKHPLFRTIGVDWAYHRSLNEMDYVHMANQVDEDFRFLIKAPYNVTDPINRDDKGRYVSINDDFLNVRVAMHELVYPVINGLGEKAGPLVFQLSPIPRPLIPTQNECYQYIDKITQFFTDLPKEVEGELVTYALEVRTLSIYTKRLLNQLRSTGVRLAIGIHPSMPDVNRQMAALRFYEDPQAEGDDWTMKGPLIARWTLNPIQKNGVGKFAYRPFNRIVLPDHTTRTGLAQLMKVAQRSNQDCFVIANNNAEGCAPLSIIELAKEFVGLEQH